jgi:BMFP domain-containing protein YqiC
MKFNTTHTQGGHKILSIHGPDGLKGYAGVVHHNDEYVAVNWGRNGQDLDFDNEYDLIPLEEPSNVTDEQPKDDERIAKLESQFTYLETSANKALDSLEERLDQSCKDLIGRINGLRNDYLADTDAVQPARVDDVEELTLSTRERLVTLEDRVEILESNSKADQLALMEMKERLEKLEKFQRYASKSLLGIWDKAHKFVERLEKLEAYNSKLDLWRADHEEFTEATWLRVLELEKKFNESTQPEPVGADRKLPQPPELGQDSITGGPSQGDNVVVSREEWEATKAVADTFIDYYYDHIVTHVAVEKVADKLIKLREGK